MILEKLDENVFYYKNVIDNVEQLKQDIEDTEQVDGIQKVIPLWDEWSACSGQMYVYGKKKNFSDEYINDLSEDAKEKANSIINRIRTGMMAVCEDYKKEKGIEDTIHLSPYIGVNKYMTGTFMGSHYDQQEGDTRLKYSLVMYLNDEYEGGEISFSVKDGILTSTDFSAREDLEDERNKDLISFWVKPEPGSVLIFPSDSPYSHTAHLVKSGWKYMIPGFWTTEPIGPGTGGPQ